MYVFVYGTLKKGEPNHHWLLPKDTSTKPEYLGIGKLIKKYPLVIATKYNVPFLLDHEGFGQEVYGEIYEIDDTILKYLDILEEYPKVYVRREEKIRFVASVDEKSLRIQENNDQLTAWVYLLKNFNLDLLTLQNYDWYSTNGSHGLKFNTNYCSKEVLEQVSMTNQKS